MEHNYHTDGDYAFDVPMTEFASELYMISKRNLEKSAMNHPYLWKGNMIPSNFTTLDDVINKAASADKDSGSPLGDVDEPYKWSQRMPPRRWENTKCVRCDNEIQCGNFCESCRMKR